MEKLSLMQRFADPELIQQMSGSEKVAASLIVALLGMLITFIVLCILWAIIAAMTKFLYREEKKTIVNTAPSTTAPQVSESAASVEEKEDEALIAVITAAIAASMQRPVQSIIVKNIKRTADIMPAWARVAKNEQLDSRRF